jgi:hypothetical protein
MVPFTAPDASIFKASLLDPLANVRLAVYADDNLFMPFCPPTHDYSEFAKAMGLVVQFGKVFPNMPTERTAEGENWGAAWDSLDPIPGVQNSPPPAGSIALDWTAKGKLKRNGSPHNALALVAAMKTAAAWPGDTTRSVMVFSRGMQWRGASVEDVLGRARQSGITLYPVSVGASRIPAGVDQMDAHSGVTWRGLQALMRLGEATGGLAFAPTAINPTTTRQTLATLADCLRTEYVAAFEVPPSTGTPGPHRVEVRLRSEELGAITGGTRVVTH